MTHTPEIKSQPVSESDRALFNRSHNGCQQARSALIIQHRGLVYQAVNRHGSRSAPYEDRVSAGFEGLLTAIDRFDPDRGYAFSTFALWRIRERIQREHLNWQDVHVPGRIAKSKKAIEQAAEGDDPRAFTALKPAKHCTTVTTWEQVLGSCGDRTDELISALDLQRIDQLMAQVLSKTDLELLRDAYGTDGRQSRSNTEVANCQQIGESTLRARMGRAKRRLQKAMAATNELDRSA